MPRDVFSTNLDFHADSFLFSLFLNLFIKKKIHEAPTKCQTQLVIYTCHLLCCLVANLCPTLLWSSVHGISQAKILEWVAISFSRGSNLCVLHGRQIFFTTEPPGKPWHIIGTSNINWIVVVQLLRHVGLFATPWTAACQASLSFSISLSLLKVMSIESVMPPNHLILSCSLLLCLQSFPASWSFPMSRFSTH